MGCSDELRREFGSFFKSEFRTICSEKGNNAAACALGDWLVKNGVKVLAADFDLTMTRVHSGGFIDPSIDKRGVLQSLSKEFDEFAEYCQSRGMRIACVTFSDAKTLDRLPPGERESNIAGASLVHRVLQSCGAKFCLDKIYAYWPRNFTNPTQYAALGLSGPMPDSKSFHLAKLRSEMGVEPHEVLLVDDDKSNCHHAAGEGYLALTLDPNDRGFCCSRLSFV